MRRWITATPPTQSMREDPYWNPATPWFTGYPPIDWVATGLLNPYWLVSGLVNPSIEIPNGSSTPYWTASSRFNPIVWPRRHSILLNCPLAVQPSPPHFFKMCIRPWKSLYFFCIEAMNKKSMVNLNSVPIVCALLNHDEALWGVGWAECLGDQAQSSRTMWPQYAPEITPPPRTCEQPSQRRINSRSCGNPC